MKASFLQSSSTIHFMFSMDKSQIAVYKKGEEPSDVLYWMSRPAIERIMALEQIIQEYNIWKYGTEQRLERVYSVVVKRKRA